MVVAFFKWSFGFYFHLNKKIPWSISFIRNSQIIWEDKTKIGTYANEWKYLSKNMGVPWTIELIVEFENNWDFDDLCENDSVWYNAIKPFINFAIIERTFKELDKQELN